MTSLQTLLIEPNEKAEGVARHLCEAAMSLASEIAVERSVKLRRGAIDWNRFLLSIDGEQLNQAAVLDAARALDMPIGLQEALASRFGSPSALILGFEQSGETVVRKLYLEYWNDVVRQVKGEADRHAPILLNLGFKWADERAVTTEYHCLPLLSFAEVIGRVRMLMEPSSAGLYDVAQQIIHLAARRGGTSFPFPYMEATEEDGRHSFDINLYNAQIDVGEIEAGIATAASVLAVPAGALSHFLRFRYCEFGHLSAGAGRDGDPFLTLYFRDRRLTTITR